MQGKTETSCDFIGINDCDDSTLDSHQMLLSQVLAMTYGLDDRTNPYKSVRGNNPCSILQLDNLDLKSLGFLLALYEHKIFIEALILGIDPFDQWGVQLGKKLASDAKSNQEFLKEYFSSSVLHQILVYNLFMNSLKLRPIILAGGSGKRLWPLSTKERPKQFISLFGDLSLFDLTLQRVNNHNIFKKPIVVTSEEYLELVEESLTKTGLEVEMVFLEPESKNTFSALTIARTCSYKQERSRKIYGYAI